MIKDKLIMIGKLKEWIPIVSMIIAFASFLLGGGFFYNQIWLSKTLTYTILPTYDIGNQVFTGLIIENRGRVNLNDIQIALLDLNSPVQAINMPGAHEPAQIVSGGIGERKLQIDMPRLSIGSFLAIYMLTPSPIILEDRKTFFISSREVSGTASPSQDQNTRILLIEIVVVLCLIFFVFLTVIMNIVIQPPISPK